MIKFIGIGSAFNTELGNNSGFIKKEGAMILIDCGGTVFERLRKFELLKDISKIYIIITHTHPDHIGSLGDLIFYCHYKLKIKPVIYFPENTLIQRLFSVVGVKENMYIIKTAMKNGEMDKELGEFTIEYLQGSHTKSIPAYSFYLTLNKTTIYYSGDSNRISKEVIEKLKKGEIQNVYQDITSIDYADTGHLSFKKLCEVIEGSLRERFYCMHLDDGLDSEVILNSGFNIAPLIARK